MRLCERKRTSEGASLGTRQGAAREGLARADIDARCWDKTLVKLVQALGFLGALRRRARELQFADPKDSLGKLNGRRSVLGARARSCALLLLSLGSPAAGVRVRVRVPSKARVRSGDRVRASLGAIRSREIWSDRGCWSCFAPR